MRISDGAPCIFWNDSLSLVPFEYDRFDYDITTMPLANGLQNCHGTKTETKRCFPFADLLNCHDLGFSKT